MLCVCSIKVGGCNLEGEAPCLIPPPIPEPASLPTPEPNRSLCSLEGKGPVSHTSTLPEAKQGPSLTRAKGGSQDGENILQLYPKFSSCFVLQ